MKVSDDECRLAMSIVKTYCREQEFCKGCILGDGKTIVMSCMCRDGKCPESWRGIEVIKDSPRIINKLF